MSMIRWWGVATFFVLLLLMALFWYLLAPQIIASSIQNLGSEALGAKVEVADVDLGLFPIAVSISGLQAADPDQPMSNIFEAQSIVFSLDSGPLLWKKIVIEELAVNGIKTGTQRAFSGELPGGRKSAQAVNAVSDIGLPKLNDIDVKDVVANAELITLKRIDGLKSSQKEMHDYWEEALDKDAFNQRLATIEQEYQRLSRRAKENKLNLIKDSKDWKRLKKQIEQERTHIASINSKLKQDKQRLSEQLAGVKRGPEDDVNAMLNQFGLGAGLEGLSDKYLGPQFTPWVKRALDMIEGMASGNGGSSDIGPSYATKDGKRVYFRDEQVFPDILVKHVNLSGADSHWSLSGDGSDLGYLPWLTGRPAELTIKLSGDGSADVRLVSAWTSSDSMNTEINSVVNNWAVNNLKFMETTEGNWRIKAGTLNSKLTGRLTLETVDLDLSLSVGTPEIGVPEQLTGWHKTFATAINQQKSISIQVSAKGKLTEPKLKVKSSVEKLFADALGAKLTQETEKLTAKFEGALNDRIGDLSELDSFQGDFDQWEKQLGLSDELLQKLWGGIDL